MYAGQWKRRKRTRKGIGLNKRWEAGGRLQVGNSEGALELKFH